MKQILHIFAKDTRRFWMEIALSMGLLAAFVWSYSGNWSPVQLMRMMRPGPATREVRYVELASKLIVLLVPSWWLLISRVVLDEPLVGDRQFWVTRPYEWKKLLAAKTLFLVCWIVVSYLLAEMLVLANAGFSPMGHLPGLLSRLLFVSAVLLLPVFALTAVTSNFARMALTLLGALALVFWYWGWVSVRLATAPLAPHRDVLLLPVLFCGCAAVLVLQYRTRRTWWARAALAAVALTAAILPFYEHTQGLIDAAYADSGAAAPLSIAYAPDPIHHVVGREIPGKTYIDLPMQYSPRRQGDAVSVDDFRFTLTAANGTQWTSPWQGTDARIMLQPRFVYLSLPLSPETFDRFKEGPVTLRIEFGVSRYGNGTTTTRLTFPSGDAAIPGVGSARR